MWILEVPLSDSEYCLSGRVYVMGRRADIHYVTILWQFKCWKDFPNLNESKNCEVFLRLHCCYHPKLPSCIWNEPRLFVNASLGSNSFQYAITFSQSLIRYFLLQGEALIRSSHLELKRKRRLNDWFGPKWTHLVSRQND